MASSWMPLVLLILLIPPLFLLKRWIAMHLQGIGLLIWGDAERAMLLYFLVLFPGIVIHELSHWLFAHLLGVRTGKISIWPRRPRQGRVRLGAVEMVRTDPLRNSLIGAAPLAIGSSLILLIGEMGLSAGNLRHALLNANWDSLWNSLSHYAQTPAFWLWLYVIFAVSNAMFPSASDRASWGIVLAFMGGLTVLAYLAGILNTIPNESAGAVIELLHYLADALTLALLVDLVFAAAIGVIERLLSWMRGARVQY